jgi:homospermidine synthase
MKTLQVVAPVLSGIVEADELDFRRNLEICMPCPGPVVGKYSDWTPLQGRGELFPEDLDKSDPWQFRNFRVV